MNLNKFLNMKRQNVLNPFTNQIIWKSVDLGEGDHYPTQPKRVTNVDNIQFTSGLVYQRAGSTVKWPKTETAKHTSTNKPK
jgi:hypothetical protein